MKVNFKLFATLMTYLPDDAVKNAVILDVDANTTPNQLIDFYHVPKANVHLVLINGIYISESERDTPLKPDDTLAIWPAVAGG